MAQCCRPSRHLGLWALIVCAVFLGSSRADPWEKEMTFTVDAGRNDCFYQTVRTGETIDLEYQVRYIIYKLYTILSL